MIGSKNVTVFMRSRSRMNSTLCALPFKKIGFPSSSIVAPEDRRVSGWFNSPDPWTKRVRVVLGLFAASLHWCMCDQLYSTQPL